MSVEGRATISDGMGGIVYEEVRAAGDIIAPVPTVGMFLNYAFLPNLVMKVHADFFDLDISDIEGKLVDSGIEAEWYFSKHVGCGLGLNITDIDYRDTGINSFEVDFRQSGLLGYLTFAF
jgi:hypothetical protein